MKKGFDIKFKGKQKYLSIKAIRFVEKRKIYPGEPFYVVLERLLGLRKSEFGFLSGHIGEFTKLNTIKRGEKNEKKRGKRKRRVRR
jgi:hypothetical protein